MADEPEELTLEAFRDGFPEFKNAADSLVQTKLDEAHRHFEREVFGGRYLDAVGYLTAHKLALSPLGTNARLNKTSDETTYSVQLRDIVALVPKTPLVIQHRCP